MFSKSLLVVVAAALMMEAQAPNSPERRVALVIGNSAYSVKGRPLKNPVNDARAMAQVLEDLGFEVISKLNAKQVEMDRAIEGFAKRLGPGSVGVFFYAGHGVQIEGLNYLLPIDYDERGLDKSNVKRASIEVSDYVLRPMEQSRARLSLVIIDACRDNPFLATQGRSASRGLAFMEPARGSAILFAAKAGQQADDNQREENGIFTKHLVEALGETGLSLVDVAEVVKERVFEATQHQQQPSFYNETIGSFIFRPGDRRVDLNIPRSADSPQISQLTADRVEVEPNQSVTLSVSASDPNADPLQYAWAATAGRIEGRGATAVFSPGPAFALQGASAVTVTVTARNSRGLEARRDLIVRLKPPAPAAPGAVLVRAIPVGPNTEVWLDAGAPGGRSGAGVIEAELESVSGVWQVIRVQGTFPGVQIDVLGECENCNLVGIVESPSASNGFLRARLRIRAINPKQAMKVRLRYQPPVNPRKR